MNIIIEVHTMIAIAGMEAIGYDTEEEIESALKNNRTMYSETLAALVFHPVDLNLQT